MLSAGGSGGITGFKYIKKSASSGSGTTYTTQASGILLTTENDVFIKSGGAGLVVYAEGYNVNYMGLFQKGAKISIGYKSYAHIFEFI